MAISGISIDPASPHEPGESGNAPLLDVSDIPHEIRHGAIIGAFESLAPGRSMIIVAPHDPVPLLEQIRQRAALSVDYLQSGPTEWILRLARP